MEDVKMSKSSHRRRSSPGHRIGFQTYPLHNSANGGPTQQQRKNAGGSKASKFLTNAEARPSWRLIGEKFNFIASTPVYKPAVSLNTSVNLDRKNHLLNPYDVPLLLESSDPIPSTTRAYPPQRKQLSNAEAIYTIVNIFVGLGMLSKPYSVAQGGWISLGGLTLLCIWGAISGLILIRCFQLVPGYRVTYAQLGQAAMGVYGRYIVQGVIVLEFMGATLIVLIFMWKNFAFLFPSIPPEWIALSLTIAALPSVWLLDFGDLSFISLLGVVANAAIMLALMGFLFYDPSQIKPEMYDVVTDWEGLSVSMGIYTVALAGHAALPGVYADIKDKDSIEWVVGLSFLIMWCIYCITAACGYLAHGRESHVLVTEDIMIKTPGIWFQFVTFLVLAKSYCSVSPIISILNEIPEEGLGITSPLIRRITRSVGLVVLASCAYLCQNHLGIVEAVTGSLFTMMSSFILPPLCLVLLSYQDAFKVAENDANENAVAKSYSSLGGLEAIPIVPLHDSTVAAMAWLSRLTSWGRAYYWILATLGVIVAVVFTYGDILELLSETGGKDS
mmetsp:Transcript_12796/g.19183  ORF Transcript_12796/g.19183 Transcript_12796/m.19183 type:complete len:558 (+) Transcript_12796:109-1782(+)